MAVLLTARNALEKERKVAVTPCSAALFPMRAFSFKIKCSYALARRELQAASFSLGPVSLSSTFFTASLAAAVLDAGTTVDSELCGLGSTESSHSK